MVRFASCAPQPALTPCPKTQRCGCPRRATDGVGSALYQYFFYLGFGKRKINERVTSVRDASGSVKLVKRCVRASCSSGERLSRSARKAARTLSIEAKSLVAIQV